MNLVALISMTDIDNELNHHNQNLGKNQKIGHGQSPDLKLRQPRQSTDHEIDRP